MESRMGHTVKDIAAALDATLHGDGSVEITGAAEPGAAEATDIALALDPKYGDDLAQGQARAAIVWEGEPIPDGGEPEVRTLTYNDLLAEVSKTANALKDLGVKRGDVVTIYMPMVPEAAIAMLACARLGAIHSVVFGGFAPNELAIRIADAKPKVIMSIIKSKVYSRLLLKQ